MISPLKSGAKIHVIFHSAKIISPCREKFVSLQTNIGHEILVYMNVTFEDKSLEELFLTGKTTARKYCRLLMNVMKRYVKVVNYIKVASRIEDLFTVGPLHYEKKSGALKGVEPVWITAQYRLLFPCSSNEDGIIVNALLEEISKRYE